jgi:hypothetical protein
MTARYRNRTEEIEAVQWTGHNTDQLRAFCGPDFDTIDPEDRAEDPDQDAQLLVEASHWVGMQPGDWVLKFEGYFVSKADATFRAVWEPAAGPAPATDRAALRERLAAALLARIKQAVVSKTQPFDAATSLFAPNEFDLADVALAVLPATADRAAVLLWAADAIDAETRQAKADQVLEPDKYRPCRDASAQLRRMAAEAQQGPHVYLSTGCRHGDHAYCQSMTGLNGAKRPGECKHCGAHCVCGCHQHADAARRAAPVNESGETCQCGHAVKEHIGETCNQCFLERGHLASLHAVEAQPAKEAQS